MQEDYNLNNQTFENNEVTPPPQKRIPYGLTEKTYNERKNIKKASRINGIAILSLLLISSLLGDILLFIFMLFGLSTQEGYALFENPIFVQVFQIVASTLIFILPFTLICLFSRQKISELCKFNLPKTKSWLPIVLMGISFCSFANMATSLGGSIFSNFGIEYDVDFGDSPTGLLGVTLTILSTAVIPPLVEEFACRGVILGSLRKFGDGFAIITSAIVFGLIHGNFQQMPFAFLIGLILGFVTVKSESVWPAIIIHAYNNLLSVVFDYLFMNMTVNMQNICYTVYLSVCLLIGIVALLFVGKDKDAFNIEKSDTEATSVQKYRWFFLTETMIFVFIICIVDSLKYFS